MEPLLRFLFLLYTFPVAITQQQYPGPITTDVPIAGHDQDIESYGQLNTTDVIPQTNILTENSTDKVQSNKSVDATTVFPFEQTYDIVSSFDDNHNTTEEIVRNIPNLHHNETYTNSSYDNDASNTTYQQTTDSSMSSFSPTQTTSQSPGNKNRGLMQTVHGVVSRTNHIEHGDGKNGTETRNTAVSLNTSSSSLYDNDTYSMDTNSSLVHNDTTTRYHEGNVSSTTAMSMVLNQTVDGVQPTGYGSMSEYGKLGRAHPMHGLIWENEAYMMTVVVPVLGGMAGALVFVCLIYIVKNCHLPQFGSVFSSDKTELLSEASEIEIEI